MKRVGLITSPITDQNSFRGVGGYTKSLANALGKIKSDKFEIINISNVEQITSSDISILHYPFFDLFRPTLKLFPNIKTVVTIHDVIPLEFPDKFPPGIQGRVSLFRQEHALSNASQVITDSNASKLAIEKRFGINNVTAIYLASENIFKPKSSALLKKIKEKYNLPDRFILFVGDINWNKNIPSLVSSCNKLSIPLVLVGKSVASLASQDLNHAELRHLKGVDFSNVIRPGFVESNDLVDIFNLATLYVQPSYAEGFGLPVLEAMACGTPVLVSNTHSLPEIVENAGCYFDPYKENDLTSVMSELLSNDQKLKKYSKLGINQANKFSWENTAMQTMGIYAKC